MKWSSPDDWAGIDLTGHCRVWTQDQDGTQRRMANRAKVWQIIGAGLNHLEGRTPRMLYAQAFDATTIESCNSNPTFTVRWLDNKINAREREVRILALPRDSDAYDTSNASDVYTNAAGASNAVFADFSNAPTFPADLGYKSFSVVHDASNAAVTEKISTTNGVPIADLCCQERYVRTFDSALNHEFVFPYECVPGAKVLEGFSEDFRDKLHRMRMGQNRLVWCWLAVAESNAYSSTDAASAHALSTASATYVNLLDATVTTRTGTSPGVMAPGYAGGVGQSNNAGVQIYLLAKVTGGSGMFKVIGPDHVADNNVEIQVDDTTATWYPSGPVYLNTESAEATDTTTARNKFDFHGSGADGNTLSVYAVLGYTLQT